MNTIIGVWLFTSLIYQGNHLPPPNPDLVMSFNFVDEKTNILKYYRKNNSGFCERTAIYSFDDVQLSQEVIKTHPDNASFCNQDTDMRLGTKSTTPVEVDSDTLLMHLQLGYDILTYVWTRQKELPVEKK